MKDMDKNDWMETEQPPVLYHTAIGVEIMSFTNMPFFKLYISSSPFLESGSFKSRSNEISLQVHCGRVPSPDDGSISTPNMGRSYNLSLDKLLPSPDNAPSIKV